LPRPGLASITVPLRVYERLQSFCYSRGLDLGKCVYFLYMLYQSMVHDPALSEEVKKKAERLMRRVEREWKEILQQSKRMALEEREEEEEEAERITE